VVVSAEYVADTAVQLVVVNQSMVCAKDVTRMVGMMSKLKVL